MSHQPPSSGHHSIHKWFHHSMHPSAAPVAPPRMVFWESTSLCNLSCIHCRRNDLAVELSRHDLQTHQVKKLLRDLAEMGKPVFVFSGGEPLMRGDWVELARFGRSLGLPIALATNGTLVDEAMAGLIAETGFARVSISLDGADRLTHDEFRCLPGCFDAAVEGAKHLRKAGVELQINSTIARHNLDQLDQLYELALKLGAAALHLFLLVPVGCGVQIAESHTITDQQYESVLEWVYERKQSAQLQLRATCAPHYYRVESQHGQPAEPAGHPGGDSTLPGRRGCLAGVSVAFVSHRGEVFPCGYLPVQAGDLNDKPFHEIWQTSPLLLQLRNPALLTGKCGLCQYKTLCGGCRARAMSQSDNYLAEEPMCEYKPAE